MNFHVGNIDCMFKCLVLKQSLITFSASIFGSFQSLSRFSKFAVYVSRGECLMNYGNVITKLKCIYLNFLIKKLHFD